LGDPSGSVLVTMCCALIDCGGWCPPVMTVPGPDRPDKVSLRCRHAVRTLPPSPLNGPRAAEAVAGRAALSAVFGESAPLPSSSFDRQLLSMKQPAGATVARQSQQPQSL
jgi:hypothetical protein